MKIYLSLLFCLCISTQLFSQGMSLEEFNQRYKQELGKITQSREAQTQALKIKYMGALLRLENQAKTQGNLDLLQATRAEITRIEQEENIADETDMPPELQDLHQVVVNLNREHIKTESEAVVKLVDNLKSYADSRSVDATRQNDIPQAVAWQKWASDVGNDALVSRAYETVNRPQKDAGSGDNPQNNVHESVQGTPTQIIEEKANEFVGSPRVYRKGKEPEGNEKRIRGSTPSMQGAGNTLLTGTLTLIEEKDINKSGFSGNYKEKSLTYVPRLTISPLIGKTLDPCLVVFDLFKRGSGSKRAIIRTDKIITPFLKTSDQIVIDAGKYEYETEEYNSSISSYDYKYSTEDEFYGFIVTIFNQKGELIFQRASERILNDYARETPP